MKSLFYRLLTATFIAFPASAYPEVTGNELYEQMNSSNKHAALMYIVGVADVLEGSVFCAPKNATRGQLYDTIESHLKLTPQYRHNPAASLISVSLKMVYPCDLNKKP